jgi:Xaa-Pro dipeptidase
MNPMTTPLRRQVRLDKSSYRERLLQIQRYLDAQALDGILILNAPNLTWASGFFYIPNERPQGLYVPLAGDPILFVPFLEKENAEENWAGRIETYWEYPGRIPAEVWMAGQIREDRIAVDSVGHDTFLKMQGIKPALTADSGIGRLRYIKDTAEIALMRTAADYADYGQIVARTAIADGLRSGITELDVVRTVQSETTVRMRQELDDLINFYRGAVALTVHTGPRAALPHGQPGPVAIKPGDAVIVGIGVKVGGYHAESGCTYVIGEPTAAQRRCLEATWACDEAAIRALVPGATCESVDAAALAVLREWGYGDFIRHRIGHGMGIEGHEAPWLSEGDETILAPNMVFSNEPGIYRPGIDGYRIIDSMLVTETGGLRLSRYLSEHGPDDRVIG